jgi:glycosyltransferase involved in cell wall biosynthesis
LPSTELSVCLLHHVVSQRRASVQSYEPEIPEGELTQAANSAEAVPLPGARVLFLDHTAAMSGGEIALLNLLRFLDPEKVQPVVVLGAEGPLAEKLRAIAETHVLPLSSRVAAQKKDKLGIGTLFRVRDVFAALAYIWRLAAFIRRQKIRLVHTNSLKADVIGGLAARLSRCPVVWHVRDRIEDDYLPWPVVRIFRLLSRAIPNYVIANSRATLRTLHLGKGARGTSIPSGIELNGKTAVVHDGATTAVPTGRSGLRSQRRVGLVGRISPWKGQHIFIQASALVNRRFPDVRFLIIGAALFGEDQYEQEVRSLPGQLGIEDIVEFTGFRSDVKRAIADLDLVVHASTKGEPFGQVIIEGMAAGKPVVATNGGGVPEIVEDGRTGILVPMSDVQAMAEAISQILSDPVEARAMGIRARQRVADHFTLQQTARRVEAVYEEVLR